MVPQPIPTRRGQAAHQIKASVPLWLCPLSRIALPPSELSSKPVANPCRSRLLGARPRQVRPHSGRRRRSGAIETTACRDPSVPRVSHGSPPLEPAASPPCRCDGSGETRMGCSRSRKWSAVAQVPNASRSPSSVSLIRPGAYHSPKLVAYSVGRAFAPLSLPSCFVNLCHALSSLDVNSDPEPARAKPSPSPAPRVCDVRPRPRSRETMSRLGAPSASIVEPPPYPDREILPASAIDSSPP